MTYASPGSVSSRGGGLEVKNRLCLQRRRLLRRPRRVQVAVGLGPLQRRGRLAEPTVERVDFALRRIELNWRRGARAGGTAVRWPRPGKRGARRRRRMWRRLSGGKRGSGGGAVGRRRRRSGEAARRRRRAVRCKRAETWPRPGRGLTEAWPRPGRGLSEVWLRLWWLVTRLLPLHLECGRLVVAH